MISKILLGSVLFTAVSMAATPTIFRGSTHWQSSAGATSTRTVEISIGATAEKGRLAIAGKIGSVPHAFDIQFADHGFFDVQVAGKKVGAGHCLKSYCQYSAKFGTKTVQESLYFHNDTVFKNGESSDDAGGAREAWQGTLSKAK